MAGSRDDDASFPGVAEWPAHQKNDESWVVRNGLFLERESRKNSDFQSIFPS